MEIEILGICGSPVKGGNTEVFLKRCLEAAEASGGVKTKLISLAGKEMEFPFEAYENVRIWDCNYNTTHL